LQLVVAEVQEPLTQAVLAAELEDLADLAVVALPHTVRLEYKYKADFVLQVKEILAASPGV
jgi:hypothetical protein